MKTKRLFPSLALAAVAGFALTGTTANAALTALVLDLTANGGINPNTGVAWAIGDKYRLAFYTAGKFDAVSSDPAVHNARVTAEAHLNPLLLGTTWTAMISTTTTNVMVNTGTVDLTGGPGIGGAGVPVYAMDGTTAIARNNADIWNAWSNPFDGDSVIRIPASTVENPTTASQAVHYSPFLNQYGLGDSGNIHGVEVWTGAQVNGTDLVGQEVGQTTNTNWGSSNANNTTRVWNRGNNINTQLRSFYAISEELTVIPEPTAALLGAVGLLALLRRRRA